MARDLYCIKRKLLEAAHFLMNPSKIEGRALHDQLTDSNTSAMRRYQMLVVGSSSLLYLVKYELIMMLVAGMPGALGLLLRKIFFPKILGQVGSSVVFGKGVSIRHGLKIRIGDNTVIDDNVTLDAKGETNSGIVIGAESILSRNTILSCKNGDIRVGERCMLGINTLVHAAENCNVSMGSDVLVAANVYIMGSGAYGTDRLDLPFKKQGIFLKGGISIADNVWLGSNAQILDGVRIGTGSIVGSSAVVTKSVNAYDIVGGVPAKLIRSRQAKSDDSSDPGG